MTDGSRKWPSYTGNGAGYILTEPLMDWFWDHYATPEQRKDPKASPLLAKSLAGLPPATVITAEFDPLRGAAVARQEHALPTPLSITEEFPATPKAVYELYTDAGFLQSRLEDCGALDPQVEGDDVGRHAGGQRADIVPVQHLRAAERRDLQRLAGRHGRRSVHRRPYGGLGRRPRRRPADR